MGTCGATLAVFLAALLAVPMHGQGLEPVRDGARVRLASDTHTVTGTLVGRTSDTVWVRLEHAPERQAFALANVERFEVSRERRSNAGRMALGGLVIGAVPGLVAGVACDCGEPGLAAVMFGAITGGLGAAIGAGIGATGKHDVWEVIPVAVPAGHDAPVVGFKTIVRLRL